MILPVQEFVFKFEKGSFLNPKWPGGDGLVFLPKSVTCYSPTFRQRQYTSVIKKELSNGLMAVQDDMIKMFKTYQEAMSLNKENTEAISSVKDSDLQKGKDNNDQEQTEEGLKSQVSLILAHPKCNLELIQEAVLGLLFDTNGTRKPTLNDGKVSAILKSAQQSLFEDSIDDNEMGRFIVEYLCAFFPSSLQNQLLNG
jgi:hypothetical protein